MSNKFYIINSIFFKYNTFPKITIFRISFIILITISMHSTNYFKRNRKVAHREISNQNNRHARCAALCILFSAALKKEFIGSCDSIDRENRLLFSPRPSSLFPLFRSHAFFMWPYRGTRGGREGVRVRTWRGLVGKPRRSVALLIPGYHESPTSIAGTLDVFCISLIPLRPLCDSPHIIKQVQVLNECTHDIKQVTSRFRAQVDISFDRM